MLSFIFNRTPNDKDLLRAIRKSHLSGNFAAQALALLDKGANANAANEENNWTALHSAAGGQHRTIVERLIEKGADVNAVSKDGTTTPLCAAVQCAETGRDPVELVKYLLSKGADPNKGSDPALVTAALFGHFESFKVLLNAGADPKATDEKGYSALHYIAREDDLTLVQMLLDKGADFGAKNSKGQTPADYIGWLDDDAKAAFLRKWQGEHDEEKRLNMLEELVARAVTLENNMTVSKPLRLRGAAPM
ncbi:MAG: ankyrin repeat domain-containing protein [Alphaproteobacteria bacterium]|nr:MAG: ankyrin repeat domain-containing protein [Alphaproteobacteria bacterium]